MFNDGARPFKEISINNTSSWPTEEKESVFHPAPSFVFFLTICFYFGSGGNSCVAGEKSSEEGGRNFVWKMAENIKRWPWKIYCLLTPWWRLPESNFSGSALEFGALRRFFVWPNGGFWREIRLSSRLFFWTLENVLGNVWNVRFVEPILLHSAAHSANL